MEDLNMAETAEKLWYVLHTYSGYENKVRDNLESRAQSMGMSDYIFRVVVPEEETQQVKDGKAKTVIENDFPGYVLVEMIMTDQAWYIVRNTPNVTGFVGSHGGGSKPTPLLPDEVDLILHRLGEDKKAKADFELEVGESVRITDGAFSDMVGKVTEVDNEKQKLKVNVTMFGRETSAELEFNQVEKIQ
ncbi:transcription termination antitermination factor NusG [Furfurilactobacillus rossiae DSM 15814]|uniref:Transcription termination/antitermination protein NusG n=3 Tax=Furfurilactobacillus TaxID=2767882 RepID=A0A0R1RHW0_9LACO|nr:transcription termination antitermination factor NusG [Furfurilactobacillus rossiae DSM 15814]